MGRPLWFQGTQAETEAAPWQKLLLVSWNMNGENGDLARLLKDLRAGHFGEADAFVLFLQEAPRRGGTVPSQAPAGSRLGKNLGRAEPSDSAHDLRVQTERAGVSVFYVPSMRNGEAAEDRGNAILSDLPLQDPVAVELPFVRNRRVAVSARIPGPGPSFRVTSVHLDHLATLGSLGRSFGASRREQIGALLEALPEHTGGVLAGDFNTWWRQESEPAIRLARSAYPSLATVSPRSTVRALGNLLGRRTDFLLPRLPEGWVASYEVLEDRYGSDHHPLAGLVRRTPVP